MSAEVALLMESLVRGSVEGSNYAQGVPRKVEQMAWVCEKEGKGAVVEFA